MPTDIAGDSLRGSDRDPSGGPGLFVPMSLYESSINPRLDALEKLYRDHEQRFDTLQTPFWKRIWFWIDGWPWHDLNGTQSWRPWHGLGPAIERAVRSIRVD